MVKRNRDAAKELREIFGTNVRVERARTGQTLEGVAHAAGTSSSYLSRVERGLVSPSLDTVARIASALGVTPVSLMDETLGRR